MLTTAAVSSQGDSHTNFAEWQNLWSSNFKVSYNKVIAISMYVVGWWNYKKTDSVGLQHGQAFSLPPKQHIPEGVPELTGRQSGQQRCCSQQGEQGDEPFHGDTRPSPVQPVLGGELPVWATGARSSLPLAAPAQHHARRKTRAHQTRCMKRSSATTPWKIWPMCVLHTRCGRRVYYSYVMRTSYIYHTPINFMR